MPRRLPTALSRRSVIGLLGLGAVLLNARGRSAQAQSTPGADPDFASLQPGQFIWHPARAPKGPVAIIVLIPRQLVFVFRNGILIGVSTCSTGKPGHSTPAGVFTILDKARCTLRPRMANRCRTWRSSPGKGSRSMSAICRAIQTRMAAFTCRPTSPTTSTPSPRSERR